MFVREAGIGNGSRQGERLSHPLHDRLQLTPFPPFAFPFCRSLPASPILPSSHLLPFPADSTWRTRHRLWGGAGDGQRMAGEKGDGDDEPQNETSKWRRIIWTSWAAGCAGLRTSCMRPISRASSVSHLFRVACATCLTTVWI